MSESGVCPRCGESVDFFIRADDRTRVCPNCGNIFDVDEILEENFEDYLCHSKDYFGEEGEE